jgi:GNAT superfamily N-acetyltransferase
LEIRLAEANDREFLFKVYASSRADEISSWGWTTEQKAQFLYMQHEAQQRFYYEQYPSLKYSIILTRQQKCGRLAIAQLADELVLVDILLLPEFQNEGIGSKILKSLQCEASEKKLLFRLSVLSGSKARRLYERFGFEAVSDDGVYTIMKWSPANKEIKEG